MKNPNLQKADVTSINENDSFSLGENQYFKKKAFLRGTISQRDGKMLTSVETYFYQTVQELVLIRSKSTHDPD